MAKRTRRSSAATEAARRASERAARVPEPRARSEASVTRGNNRWDALSEVEKSAELERSVVARKDRQVVRARAAGATWTDLARALGVTPQAVQQKYSRLGAPPGSDS